MFRLKLECQKEHKVINDIEQNYMPAVKGQLEDLEKDIIKEKKLR
jgi:hypothetical protein